MRSGGNWLTWPFKVVSLDEIATLGAERRARREVGEEAFVPAAYPSTEVVKRP